MLVHALGMRLRAGVPLARRFLAATGADLREPKIGLISGSSRVGSFNQKLVKFAGKIAEAKGATVEFIPLDGDHELPIYSQDIEAAGFPEAAVKLKAKLAAMDAWIVAGPEYNGFATPLFINSVAWASRGDPDGEMYATFKGKLAAVVATSPGGLGGMRSLGPYKELLTNLGVTCLPMSVAVGGAFNAFAEDGSLLEDRFVGMLDGAVGQLVHLARGEANRDVACGILTALKKASAAGEYGAVSSA